MFRNDKTNKLIKVEEEPADRGNKSLSYKMSDKDIKFAKRTKKEISFAKERTGDGADCDPELDDAFEDYWQQAQYGDSLLAARGRRKESQFDFKRMLEELAARQEESKQEDQIEEESMESSVEDSPSADPVPAAESPRSDNQADPDQMRSNNSASSENHLHSSN